MIKNFKTDNEYDYHLDIYTITVKENFKFGKSLELEEGVILDFDENDVPISIEILDISKRLGIKKSILKSADAHMRIICNKDILEVKINFIYKIHEKEFNGTIDSKIANNYDLPQMDMATA